MKLLPALFSTVTAATTTVLLTLATPAVWAQAAAPAAAASAPTFSVRPEVGAALNQAVDLFRAGKAAEARSRVEKAQLELKELTPVEVTVMHRLRGLFSLQLDQPAEAVKSLEAAMAVNAQSVQDQLTCMDSLARAHFNAKSFPAAIEWARKAQAAGSKAAPVQAVLVRASYSIKDYPAAIALLEAQEKRDGKLAMEDTAAAGLVVRADQGRRQLRAPERTPAARAWPHRAVARPAGARAAPARLAGALGHRLLPPAPPARPDGRGQRLPGAGRHGRRAPACRQKRSRCSTPGGPRACWARAPSWPSSRSSATR
jgi:tetratricopeptide (TPR) repeat protein